MRSFSEVFKTDISEKNEFTKYGNTFKKVKFNPSTNVYVYGRYKDDGVLSCYEVVKPVKRKNPDGSTVNVYPNDEQFGVYGKCVDINRYTNQIVDFLVNNPDKWGPEDMYNFKKTL